MKTQFILIACLAIARQIFGTQVYETPSDSSEQQWQPWKTQDSIQASNGEEDKYRPVTFDASASQQKESQQSFYNANIQSGASGVADVVGKQPIDSVIDNILVSNRQGRNLEGYDEVYSDPNVQNALQLGNDTIARTYIRDKLCSLGLMNCEDMEGRRPYYSPHRDIHPLDVIYAQPVTIKPVGRPLPAIPVKRPYGPAKPVPLPPSFGGSPLGPNIYPGLGPTFGRPPPSFVGPYPGYKKPGLPPPFVSKPVYDPGVIEPDFEDKFIDKKQVVLHQPSASGVQQHVHHHYHHGEGAGIAPNPVVGSSPTFGGLGSYGYGNGGTYGATINDFEDYKKAFKIKAPASNGGPSISSSKGYANRYPTYEKPNGKQFASGGQLGGNNQFLGNGGYDGDYPFNNGADSSFGSTSYEDCVCVPYDQCATINHVGRKDDLYLAIDPRNLDKDIEAETVEVVITDGNGTMNVVRVPKGVNETEQIEQTKNERTEEEEAGKAEVTKRNRRDVKHVTKKDDKQEIQERRYGRPPACGAHHVCCQKSHIIGARPRPGQCGVRNTQGINGRIKTPVYVDGDSEFGEYPWQVAILKKDTTESVYVCGGTLISPRHIITAAHCVKTHAGRDLRARLGEWDVNHDVEFYPYIERDIVSVFVHPEFYAGTLANDIAILKLDHDVDFEKNPHISAACLPDKHDDFTGTRCWTTGWGKDAFGDYGKYQNILKEVDVPVVSNYVCEQQMRRTRLGPTFNLHPGFICAGGEEGKDACKGDGGGPMVCERHGHWQLTGIVSWGIGCGQPNVPGVYARVSHYLDWIRQIEIRGESRGGDPGRRSFAGQPRTMPIKLIGRTTDFKGKPLWEILGNLKNFGVGRLVIRNRFQRYPEPCYMKILKVAGMPMPEEPYTDRKVMVLVERVFRGQKNPKPVQLDSATYKADYMLIPKDQEHLYLNNTKVPEMRILPKMTDLPPLFSQLVIRQMKAKGVVAPAEPKLNLRYNFYGRSVKNYRLVEEGETPTVELNFRVDESSVLFPKPEKTAAS
ncbi:uncharacterized protein LOC112456373 [Temnothorax curvispinosus]|uniref:Phenoloxidase-activating factor 2 n=1 Tax=Temnothorax curvispinosus TaxID=300111 RepID=A0A6J1Q0Z1_9HYME|nr:uncharacterized protein LOC112456373 [Temnothorax curvispinosus]